MSSIKRPIHGPNQHTERPENHRPVRVGTERVGDVLLGEPAAFIIGGAGILAGAVPALIPILAPLTALYGGAVLTKRQRLPLRLPITAKRKDPNSPAPGTRRAQMAAGIIYLGVDAVTGQQLWLTNEDARQHLSIPGVTGAGKTEVLLALVANALAMGSGCVIVDGKADAKLPAQLYELARRFGREKDIRHINFLTASGEKESNSFNPFAWATADAVREMLLSQLEKNPEGGGGDRNEVFSQRGTTLIEAWSPVWEWLRDHKRAPLDIHAIQFSTDLENIDSMATRKVYRHLNLDTGEIGEVDASGIPEGLLYPLRAYLGKTPGYDTTQPWNKQKSHQPSEQHGYATMGFSRTFTQMAVSLGHIFGRGWSDIDMRDVVLNRRILLVSLPALENSGETTAALGKLTIAAIRGMLSQSLGGGKLEGDSVDLIENRPTTSDTPFLAPLDELAAFAGGGLHTLMQQARGLGVGFALGWHDVEGLKASIGNRAWTVLNNATTSIIMRQNAGGESRRFIEGTVGDAAVTRVSGYDTRSGSPREAPRLEVGREARVNWLDARELIEGEAIIVQANRRVYARMFHTGIKGKGALRMNRPLPLAPPDPASVRSLVDEMATIRTGLLAPDISDVPPPPVLAAVLQGLHVALEVGCSRSEAVEAALCAAGSVAVQEDATTPATVGAPISDFTPTLTATAAGPVTTGSPEDTATSAVSAQTAEILASIVKIAEALGASPEEAKQEAHRTLAERDAAHDGIRFTDPAPMSAPDLVALLGRILGSLGHHGR